MKNLDYIKSLNIETIRDVDIIVVGGGCAGLAAAISSARKNLQVLLIEKNSFLGGMATAGLVGPFMTCFNPNGDKQIIKGFFEEFVDKLIEKDGAIHPSKVEAGTSYSGYRVYGHAHCCPFDSEIYKIVAEEMCVNNNVELLYNTIVVDTCVSDNIVEGLVIANKEGLQFVKAKEFIDCTGDADIAYQSGAPFFYGDENGETQPGTLFFTIRGVDKNKLEEIKRETGDFKSIFYQELISKEIQEGRFSVPREKLAIYENPDGSFRVNMSRVYLKNACNQFEYTKASIIARKQVFEIIDMMKRLIPGCENIELVDTAALLGLRETRRIDGEYTLTFEDIENKTKFNDTIFMSGNSVDLHQGSLGNYIPIKGEAFSVPYRILVPKKIDNLLVAGRSCSADRKVLSAIRVMPPVFAMGQAAGIASFLAIKEKTSVRNIDTIKLQEELKNNNVILD